MYMHIKAVEALRAVHGVLPLNLKFLSKGRRSGRRLYRKYVEEHPES